MTSLGQRCYTACGANHARVAQRIERLSSEQKVGGSIPSAGTKNETTRWINGLLYQVVVICFWKMYLLRCMEHALSLSKSDPISMLSYMADCRRMRLKEER